MNQGPSGQTRAPHHESGTLQDEPGLCGRVKVRNWTGTTGTLTSHGIPKTTAESHQKKRSGDQGPSDYLTARALLESLVSLGLL